jgi:Domain of unknown function (DUF4157)
MSPALRIRAPRNPLTAATDNTLGFQHRPHANLSDNSTRTSAARAREPAGDRFPATFFDFEKIAIFGPCPEPALRHSGSPSLQPKLVLGSVSDPLEREADRVAEQVMRAADPAISNPAAAPQVSRKCAACEQDDKPQMVRTKSAGPDLPTARAAPAIVLEVLNSSGQPLDSATRAFFEPRFGQDFSRVRVHRDPKAAESARAVNALAYTVGQNIAFGMGQFFPHTSAGQRLIAHELAHTLQQRDQSAVLQRQDDQGNGGIPASAGTSAADNMSANLPSEEGRNRDSDIEWTSQGPSAPPSALSATAACTPEITLETGNTGASPLNNAVHQQVCADTCDGNGKRCFSFGATGAQAPEFSSTWLGWDSTVVGAIMKGEIYDPFPVPGASLVGRLTPSAAQVANWLSYMSGTRLGLQDGYSVIRHNCRTFSQWEFRDASSHW